MNRAFGIQSSKPLFLSMYIIDRYLRSKDRMRETLTKYDLHEIILVSVFISFKYEYDHLLSLKTLLREAGHRKFLEMQTI